MNIINSNLTFRGLDKSNRKENIILHHAEASKCSVHDIHRWHLNNGWSGIGYHYFITKAGLVYTGRPVDAVGAHAVGYNSNSIGICAEGSLNKEVMPQVQKQAIIDLCRYLVKTYGIKKVLGHREVNATDWSPSPEDVDSAIALKADKATNGTTATRPIPTYIGQTHFDTTLGKPIWCKTISPIAWVDSTGTTV